MKRTKTRPRRVNRRSQVLPLALIGGGLVVLGIAAFILLPGLVGAKSPADLPVTVPAEVNFAAPPIELTDLGGSPVSLADHRGQVVLVNNWATWCPPCKAEMPTLQAYFDKHERQRFTIIAIEAGSAPGDVSRFARDYGLTFLVWPDPDEKALDAFRTDTLPSSYVVDRDGIVRLAWMGAINDEMLEKYVTPLLEE